MPSRPPITLLATHLLSQLLMTDAGVADPRSWQAQQLVLHLGMVLLGLVQLLSEELCRRTVHQVQTGDFRLVWLL